jgi:di/tricarboxylate transporter
MSGDQVTLLSILGVMLVLLVWGRWRYDLVAFTALLVSVIIGVVPSETMFAGFSHPAVVIIALVLVITRGLSNSGAIELIGRRITQAGRSLSRHIGIFGLVGAGMSAIMNNVAALALLMPLDMQTAERAKRSPSLSLMPLSFATIFGGLITMIGTPPNIIVSSYREKELGGPFAMLDFAPVGLTVAIVGLLFLSLIGWRLVPRSRRERNMGRELRQIDEFITELRVGPRSPFAGKDVASLDKVCTNCEVVIMGLIRGDTRIDGDIRGMILKPGDILMVEATAREADQFVGEAGLDYLDEDSHGILASGDLVLHEVVVPAESEIIGRTAQSLALQSAHGVSLLGISRRSRKLHERIQTLPFEAGDILLLYGPQDRVMTTGLALDTLPLSGRGASVVNRDMARAAMGIFAVAILLASFNVLPLIVALSVVAVLMVFLNIVPIRQVYNAIEWPVIILLASLIPIGAAVEQSGATSVLTQELVTMLTGAEPWQILAAFMTLTMLVANVLNNTATAVVAAPVGASMASSLQVSPDPFLMAVAIGASCAFLTPIGHKTNTLIMGPGGYKFGDYWIMGLPTSIVAVAVAVPMILYFWPF